MALIIVQVLISTNSRLNILYQSYGLVVHSVDQQNCIIIQIMSDSVKSNEFLSTVRSIVATGYNNMSLLLILLYRLLLLLLLIYILYSQINVTE